METIPTIVLRIRHPAVLRINILHPEQAAILRLPDAALFIALLLLQLHVHVDHLPAGQIAPVLPVPSLARDAQPARLVAYACFFPAVESRWVTVLVELVCR